MSERILVTGATGKLGRELVRQLIARGEVVRAATRFPTRARQLFGAGLEVVEMDYEATETYDAAVQWVDRLFLMPPPFDPHAYQTIVPFLDWAVAAGVGKVVLLSAMGAETMPDLALRKIERHIESLRLAATIIRPNLYHQNFLMDWVLNSLHERGAFRLCVADGRVSFVDVRDVAWVAAAALTSDLPGAFTLTGPAALSLQEVASLLSQAAGHAIRYEPVTPDQMRDVLRAVHWSEPTVESAIGLLLSVAEGRREPVRGDLGRILHRPPIPFEQFARENARVWR
jgi:uncharacterized protein YbjT (DUF2867 family)